MQYSNFIRGKNTHHVNYFKISEKRFNIRYIVYNYYCMPLVTIKDHTSKECASFSVCHQSKQST
jgi:hypothetical protein